MACSAVTLSIATIMSIIAIACLVISFTTDNWYEFRLDRNKTRGIDAVTGAVNTEFDTDYRYFSRDEGLFRLCFVDKKPKNLKTYLSPTQSECININYHIPEDEETDQYDSMRWERLRKSPLSDINHYLFDRSHILTILKI